MLDNCQAGLRRREVLKFGLTTVVAACGSGCREWEASETSESRFVAFSLRRATDILGQAGSDGLLKALGGITRIAGTVYDPGADDVILFGLNDRSLPVADFDYLVTALQARFQADEFPLVSIDPVADTQKTRQQRVRFVGPLADSRYGRDLLACDVLLKRYSLSLADAVLGAPSYTQLLERDVRESVERDGSQMLGIEWQGHAAGTKFAQRNRGARVKSSTSYQSRFWFYVQLPYRSDCEPDNVHPEVFLIRELRLRLLSDLVFGGQAGHYAQQEFSRRFSEHLVSVAGAHPILQRLKIIYDLTAAADAIRALDRNVKPLGWIRKLLHNYRVALTPTPREYPLVEQFGLVRRSDGLRHMVSVNGGITFARDRIADAVENVGYGVLAELRSLVLGSRPSKSALSWRVPLEGWSMPNARDLQLPKQRDWDAIPWLVGEGGGSGFSLQSESVTLAPDLPGVPGIGPSFTGFSGPAAVAPLAGVSMRVDLSEASFQPSTGDNLKLLKEAALQSRRGSKMPASEIDP